MNESVLVVFALLVGTPVALAASIALIKPQSRLQVMSQIALTGVFLFFFTRAGAGWHLISASLPMLLWALLCAASMFGLWRSSRVMFLPQKKVGPWLLPILFLGMTAFFGLSLSAILGARDYEGEPVKLVFPLKDGTFYVTHGGASPFLNQHHVVPAQQHALDLVALDGIGRRADGLFPSDLDKYVIYGAEVVAPCTGKVTATESALPEMTPPEGDSENVAGNHVLLACDDVTVLLAHLQKDSVVVKKGQRVKAGRKVGLVGNSGNTSEPHLHIHAVKGVIDDVTKAVADAEPVPMTFAQRYLVRNDKVGVR